MPSSPSSRCIFDLPGKTQRLAEIEKILSQAGFWNNPDQSKDILKERARLKAPIERIEAIAKDLEDSALLLDMAVEEDDAGTVAEVRAQVDDTAARVERLSLEMMLDGQDDHSDAILSINAGAGGTEAQDWAEILLRMYTRWIERNGYQADIIDYQPGEEAGIKSATLTVKGENAYGYLKSESGVHRLVRISPFNASGKRMTSFAAVFVYPDLDQEITIDIDEKDLRTDVFRASGAGGQHVNKTSSAVRITHLPTGIVVQCQQERSQHRNRDMAMKVLRARLYQREKEAQEEKLQQVQDGKEEITWGSQIRSYVMQPYQMVKDHRIHLDVGNIQDVLDGGLQPFIEGVLLAKKANKARGA